MVTESTTRTLIDAVFDDLETDAFRDLVEGRVNVILESMRQEISKTILAERDDDSDIADRELNAQPESKVKLSMKDNAIKQAKARRALEDKRIERELSGENSYSDDKKHTRTVKGTKYGGSKQPYDNDVDESLDIAGKQLDEVSDKTVNSSEVNAPVRSAERDSKK